MISLKCQHRHRRYPTTLRKTTRIAVLAVTAAADRRIRQRIRLALIKLLLVMLLPLLLLLQQRHQYYSTSLVQAYSTSTIVTTLSTRSITFQCRRAATNQRHQNQVPIHQLQMIPTDIKPLRYTTFMSSQSTTSTAKATSLFASRQQQQQRQQYNQHLPTLVDGAKVDERFDSMIFPGPIRGIGLRNNIPPNTVQPNTRIATIPAQNVLIVSNYRQEKNFNELLQKYGTTTKSRTDPQRINYNEFAMWDRDLAILLWKEYLQVIQEKKSTSNEYRTRSPLTGYIEYICQQDDYTMQENNPYYELYDDSFNVVPFRDIPNIDLYVPPSVAPHTLRHWNNEQKQLLSQSRRGEQLLQIADQQEQVWRIKYTSIRYDPAITDPAIKNIRMSYMQFRWAMEVVHSRAFCGLPIKLPSNNDGTTTSAKSDAVISNIVQPALPGIVLPVAAAVIGYIYMISNVYANEYVLMLLAMIGAIPLLIQLFSSFFTTVKENVSLPVVSNEQQPRQYKNVDQSAVLLPIIDSANHDIRTKQDTNIVYNPFQHTFEWYIGPKSIVECLNNADRIPVRRPPKQQTFASSVPTTNIASTNDVFDSNLSVQASILYQICISYGKTQKSDNEWMINYGFLPGIDINADIDNFTQYRYFLSQMYLERNP